MKNSNFACSCLFHSFSVRRIYFYIGRKKNNHTSVYYVFGSMMAPICGWCPLVDSLNACIGGLQKSLERLEDASTELMMASAGDTVMLLIGESFFETNEDSATEYCESEVEKLSAKLESLVEEETKVTEEQEALKKVLYARFGKSIQLEA